MATQYPFAERRSALLIRRAILLVVLVLLPLFAASSYRAYVQIKSLALQVPDTTLREGSALRDLSREHLTRFQPGPALLQAVARGSMQWLREPPPSIRQQAVRIDRAAR